MFYLVLFMIACAIPSFVLAADDPLLDKEMAAKYGLTVPPPHEEVDPAPEWLQRADMFTGSGGWKDHEFTLVDTVVSRIVRARAGHRRMELVDYYPVETVEGLNADAIEGVTLISHVPHSKDAYRYAHEAGFKVIPYVHFMCIHTNYADQDVFYYEHPEIMIKDVDGRWVHTPMDGSDRLHRFLTCANSPSYWKLSLAYVKKMMDWGADGVFVDNVGRRKACLADRFNRRNPEFASFTHEHLFPGATHDYAWDRMLQAIRALVKSYGDDKIVVLNSGIDTQFQKDGDCCMWESFIYSWAWEGRRHTWDAVKARAKRNEWYLEKGRRITALSTINRSRAESKDDAFWAFSAARLVDFVWWAGLRGSGAEILNKAHLGGGVKPYEEIDGVAYRPFRDGLIVLNDSMDDRKIDIPLPAPFKHGRLLDLFAGSKSLRVRGGKVTVQVPRKKARVYLAPEVLSD
jgi:hypothetical protein